MATKQIKNVTIEWSEAGKQYEGRTFDSILDADCVLAAAAMSYPANRGGAYKTQVKVEWTDGETYLARLELAHPTRDAFTGITAHIRRSVEWMRENAETVSNWRAGLDGQQTPDEIRNDCDELLERIN